MSLAQRAAPRLTGKSIISELPASLAKRASQARRQALRNRKANHERAQKAAKWDWVQRTTQYQRAWRSLIRDERRNRREDYELGPLAPKRDVGALADTFGALTLQTYRRPDVFKPKECAIVVGDRVVVYDRKHRDSGKIGVVKEVTPDSEELIVEGVNLADLAIPEHMLLREQDKTPVRPYEFPLPISSVRLVVPLRDPATGAVRDTMISSLRLDRLTRREFKGIDPPTRSVAGTNPPIYVPYPEKPDETESAVDTPMDTLRIEVENRTWTPTVHMPPMPPLVVDELRNKFGKFRIRHEESYVAQKAREERNKAENQARRRLLMMTPLKERRRRERLERKTLGRPELSDEALAHIGSVIEKNLSQGEVVEAERVRV